MAKKKLRKDSQPSKEEDNDRDQPGKDEKEENIGGGGVEEDEVEEDKRFLFSKNMREGDEDEEDSCSNADSDDQKENERKIKKKKKSLIRKEAEEFSQKLARRGVVYMSRVPPFMKPNKLRMMLESHGEITRLYLAEEDAAVRKRRKAAGGNGSKQFVEGWIEFADKREAKRVAKALNNTKMGGRKRDYYHDDLWNLKYLKNFKWDHLTEKFAYERRVRESKLKAAMLQAKRQNAEFVEMLDKQEAYQHIKKRKEEGGSHDAPQAKRKFRQLRGASSEDQEGTVKTYNVTNDNCCKIKLSILDSAAPDHPRQHRPLCTAMHVRRCFTIYDQCLSHFF